MSCWTGIYPAFANSVDPDQLASEEANWSGSALFVIQYVNLYQQPGSSNLIGWKLEVGVAALFSMTRVKYDITIYMPLLMLKNVVFFTKKKKKKKEILNKCEADGISGNCPYQQSQSFDLIMMVLTVIIWRIILYNGIDRMLVIFHL